MKTEVKVCAGACGFENRVVTECEDGQQVNIAIESACPKMQKLAAELREKGGLDVYDEMSPGDEGVLAAATKGAGCCTGCAMPSAISKASQISAGLMLPRDVTMTFSAS